MSDFTEQRLTEIERRLTEIEEQLNEQARTIDNMDLQVDRLLARTDNFDGRIASIRTDLDELSKQAEEAGLDTLTEDWENLKAKVDDLVDSPDVEGLRRDVEGLKWDMNEAKTDLRKLLK